MSHTKALAWNTGVQILGKAVSTAIGVVIVSLMTRHLGDIGFGMYSTANAFFQIFAIMLDLGLNVMLVQMLGERAGDTAYENRAISATFTLRILSALVLLGIAPIIGLALPYPLELKLALFAIWGSFFVTALNQIVIGVQQRHLKMQIVAISEVVGRIVLLVGLLLSITMHWGLIPIVLIVSIGSTINFLINIIVAKRYASFAWNWDPEFWRILIKRSWPIGVSILFNLIYFKADTLILSLVRPFQEVGVYSVAYRVLEILTTLPFMYTGVLLPLLARAWTDKNKTHFQSLLSNSYIAMFLLVAPIMGSIYILGPRVLTLIAGPDFAASSAILNILLIAVGLIFLGTVSSHAIVALDAQRKMMPVYIIVAILTLIGYVAFIPTYGMWAAAWLTVFSEGLVALASTIISIRRSDTKISWMPLFKIAVVTVIMTLSIQAVKHAWLPIPIAIGSLVYIGLILASGAVSKETLKEVLHFKRDSTSASLEK